MNTLSLDDLQVSFLDIDSFQKEKDNGIEF